MNKIVIVHWKSGLTRWYPYTLDTLDEIAGSMCAIDLIEILECGIEAELKIVTGGNNE